MDFNSLLLNTSGEIIPSPNVPLTAKHVEKPPRMSGVIWGFRYSVFNVPRQMESTRRTNAALLQVNSISQLRLQTLHPTDVESLWCQKMKLI